MKDPASLREIFEAVVAMDAAGRASFLMQNCVDAEQRAAVESLLAADDAGGLNILQRPIDAILERIGDADAALTLPITGTTIGPFVLLDKIGEGGRLSSFAPVGSRPVSCNPWRSNCCVAESTQATTSVNSVANAWH